jgi:hypothetical protein
MVYLNKTFKIRYYEYDFVCRKYTNIAYKNRAYLHSFPMDQLNKSHGGHVGVPGSGSKQKSLIKILLNWNTNMAAVTSCANAL